MINAGTIAGAAGIAFDVNGGGVGGGGVVYDGAINDGPGQSVEVTGRDGGGVTFSGNIADSGDAGGGIVVSGNSDGSTSSRARRRWSTPARATPSALANGDPATGTTSPVHERRPGHRHHERPGLEREQRPVTVGGTGNTITTGTGVGLNVDTTRIMPGGLNFDPISSNGATQGIR